MSRVKRIGDGSVLPHTLRQLQNDQFKDENPFLMFRTGTVVGIYYPDDTRNVSKAEIEYDVSVFESDPMNTTFRLYRNCRLTNLFGAANNNLTYTLHVGQQSDDGIKGGAQVTILCLNASAQAGQAIIVGGLNYTRPVKYSQEDGQFYDFNFNGIQQLINKDGEYILTFRSNISDDGNQENPQAAESFMKIDKEGRIQFKDNEDQEILLDRDSKTVTIQNGSEKIIINKETKSISIEAADSISERAKKSISEVSDGTITSSAKKDWSANADANMSLVAKNNMTQKSNANWQVTASANVEVKSGGNVTMNAQGQAQLKGALTLIGNGSAPVAAVGVSQCLGTDSHGAPVLSQILTGSATVLVGT